MRIRKNLLVLALLGALLYAGWDWLRVHVEVVTLHVRAGAGSYDHYPRLLIVDDGTVAWVRAERRDRFWLAALRADPKVVVRRRGRDLSYTAVDYGPRRLERIEGLFRAKYGVLDTASGWLWRRDPVLILLERRS